MKTAVEFLEDILNKRLNHLVDHRVHIKEFVRTAKSAEVRKILEIINKAKEMDKERVIDFAKKFSDFNGLTFNEKEVSKEYLEKLYDKYYKETFKSE